MRKILLSLLLAMWATSALADIEGAPFSPEEDARFNAIEQGNHYRTGSYPTGSTDGHWTKQEVQATYDFAAQTGAIGTYDLGTGLPANAIIQRVGIYTLTQPVSNGQGLMAFYCQTPNDLLNPTNVNYFPPPTKSLAGLEPSLPANWSTVTAKCDVHATISGAAVTAGKVTVYIDYVVHK